MNIIKKIIDIIFPHLCISCEKITTEDNFFCTDCLPKIEKIKDPKCSKCSLPFDIEIIKNSICGLCFKKKLFYDKVTPIFVYDNIIANAISNFKYKDQPNLGKKFTKLILNELSNELENFDYIIPVPLHKNKLTKRKYNQSAIIAKLICKKKYIPDLLFRVFDNISQVKLKKNERQKNLKHAFRLNTKYQNLIKGKTIIIIDDVITTGATINYCSKELKRNGVKKVIVIAIAKRI